MRKTSIYCFSADSVKARIRLYQFKEKAQLVYSVVYTMWGIVGVVGNTNAHWYFDSELEKLGIPWLAWFCGDFVLGGAENHLVGVTVGRIAELSAKTAGVEGTTGIGHTRWATHEKPTRRTTLTHTALRQDVLFLVHNGVIENYLGNPREEYLAGPPLPRGKQIREIAVHLIGKFAEEEGLSVLEAFKSPFTSSVVRMPLPWLTLKESRCHLCR